MAPGPGTSLRVLVVDDTPSFREVVCSLLERRGYLVAGQADCAASALSAVSHLCPDAVLLDVNLPDLDGFALAVRLLEHNPELAVLLTSADDLGPELPPGCPARGVVPKRELAAIDFGQFWPAR